MAEAIHRVGIEVDIDSANVAARIKAIEKQIKAMEKAVSRLDRRGDGINDRFKKLDNRMGSLGQAVKRVTGLFTKLFTTFAKFGFLAMAGEIAIFTAGLLAVKLALITGRAAASLYNITLKGLSVTAASVATALSVAAGAMREFSEAQLSPFFANAQSGPSRPLTAFGRRAAAGKVGRGIGATTSGLLGMEGTQQVVAALARAGITGNQGIGLAQGLGNLTNFDPKAMAQIIQALGGSLKSGSISPSLQAVQNAVGFRGGTISANSVNSLIGQISSGSLTGRGFQGQGDMLSRTLIGTFKTSFTGIRDQFADIGVGLLEPMRQSFLEIAQILQRSMLSLQVIIQKFGADSMGPTMVTIFDRMMKFITENIIDHLDNIKEMGENFVGFFRAVRNFFVGMGDFLGRYEPAANVIIDMFKAASGANPSALFRNFSEGLVANADRIKEFGAGMGRLFGGIFSLFESGNQGFFGGLERITDITDAIADDFIPALKEFFVAASPIVQRIPTVIEGLSSVLSMIAPVIHMLAQVIGTLIDVLGNLPGVGSAGVGVAGLMAIGGMAMMRQKGLAGMATLIGGKARGGAIMAASSFRNARAGFTAARAGGLYQAGVNQFGQQVVTRNLFAGTRGFMRGLGGTAPGYGTVGSSGHMLLGPNTAGLAGLNASPFKLGLSRAMILPALGGALSVHEGIKFLSPGGGSVIDTGKASFGGILSGGMIGAGIGAGLGSFFGPAGTVAGAKLGAMAGALFDPIGAAIMSAFGIDSRQMKNTKSHHRAFGKIRAENEFLSGTRNFHTDSRSLFDRQTRALDLYEQAIEAHTRTGKGGDTEAFRQFLKFIGADPDMVHRDEYFNRLARDGFGDETLKNIRNMEIKQRDLLNQGMEQANIILGNFKGALGVTNEAMNQFVQSLGFDPINMNPDNMAAAATVLAARRLQINRNMAILPSMAQSELARQTHRATASAKLNALAQGDVSPAAINDFIQAKASFEISRGKSPDIAALSGILDLFMFGKMGHFGANTSLLNDAGMSMAVDMAKQMEMLNYGTYEQIMGFIMAGNMEGLDKMVQGKADFRDAVGGGNLSMSPTKRLKVLGKNTPLQFDERFINSIGSALGQGDLFDRVTEGGMFANNDAARILLSRQLEMERSRTGDPGMIDQAITRALIDAGMTGNQLETLHSINRQLGANLEKISEVKLVVNSVEMGGTENSVGAFVNGQGTTLDIDQAQVDNLIDRGIISQDGEVLQGPFNVTYDPTG